MSTSHPSKLAVDKFIVTHARASLRRLYHPALSLSSAIASGVRANTSRPVVPGPKPQTYSGNSARSCMHLSATFKVTTIIFGGLTRIRNILVVIRQVKHYHHILAYRDAQMVFRLANPLTIVLMQPGLQEGGRPSHARGVSPPYNSSSPPPLSPPWSMSKASLNDTMSVFEKDDQGPGSSNQRVRGVYFSAALVPRLVASLPNLRTSREKAKAEDFPPSLFVSFVSVEERPFACEIGFVGLLDVTLTRQWVRESFKRFLLRTVSVA